MSITLVLVGCGNMGFAMLEGWIQAKVIAPQNVAVVEPNADLRNRASRLGVAVYDDAQGVQAADPELVILAVKPQVMADVAPAYRGLVERGAAVLSIAAGTPVATFKAMFGKAAIMRCMPNTPAAVGRGVMALYANPNVSQASQAFAETLLSANGVVVPIADENQMDAVTAVSGSGPAYVFYFIECLTQAALQAGLPEDAAKLLAMQTVAGAGALAAGSGKEPGQLRKEVTSPNGTTAAALDVLMDDDRLATLVAEAVDAAKRRSIELRG